MLIKATKMNQLCVGKLVDGYASSICEDAEKKYPYLSETEKRLQAEQDFYTYLQDFFTFPAACYFVLQDGDEYVSALRLEQYKDGCLLSALETKPNCRKRGYGKSLVHQVLAQLPEETVVYTHIKKKNEASIAVHTSCGFYTITDCATLLDGTVSREYLTMLYRK